MLTQERLKEILHYNPATGLFTWLVRPGKFSRRRIGDIAGYSRPDDGYVTIRIDGRGYYGHRLAFLYMTGKFPDHDGEHKNTDGSDNRWENLREATRSQNLANTKVKRNSVTGVKGVSIHHSGKYKARILLNGKPVNLGHYDTIEFAAAAYAKAANDKSGEFARVA